jgi:predicted phosphate transport protein (TIGR00153 family)
MFQFLFKKEHVVENLIYKYLETFEKTRENFNQAFYLCVEKGNCKDFDFLAEQTNKYESMADDIIDDINNQMYGKVLIPDSREDVMNLLLGLDKIPHIFEKSLFMIKYQNLEIPAFIFPDIRHLVDISVESCEILVTQVTHFLKKEKGIRDCMNRIDVAESHCDHIEKKLIADIFDPDSEIDPYLRLQFKELVVRIGDISDQADRVAKLVNVLSLKRRV